MKNKDKVLKLKPAAYCLNAMGIFQIFYDEKRQCYSSRESWAWAEAYRDLYFQYSSQSL